MALVQKLCLKDAGRRFADSIDHLRHFLRIEKDSDQRRFAWRRHIRQSRKRAAEKRRKDAAEGVEGCGRGGESFVDGMSVEELVKLVLLLFLLLRLLLLLLLSLLLL